MALDENRLKDKIAALMQDMLTRENTSINEFADVLAKAVVFEVKQAQINYQSGLTAPNGPVTGNFQGNLS